MPMPRSFRRVARALNPAVRPLARRLPPLAVVHHVGRTTGRQYESPVMAFQTERGWIVSLAYGSDVQWARNLDRAGSGALTRAGHTHQVSGVRAIRWKDAAPSLPAWARGVLRSASVDDFLFLTR
jgi:deazaflavin-dependent oxidoreductase (nitroreductase family)